VKDPGTGKGATILLWRPELPVARRFESDAGEVGARPVRGVLDVGDCAIWIDTDTHDNADCAMNGVACTLRNFGYIAVEHVAAGGRSRGRRDGIRRNWSGCGWRSGLRRVGLRFGLSSGGLVCGLSWRRRGGGSSAVHAEAYHDGDEEGEANNEGKEGHARRQRLVCKAVLIRRV